MCCSVKSDIFMDVKISIFAHHCLHKLKPIFKYISYNFIQSLLVLCNYKFRDPANFNILLIIVVNYLAQTFSLLNIHR